LVLTAGTVVFASGWSAVTPPLFFFAEESGSDGQRVASADLNAMECLVSKRFLVGRMQ
jgi:hypothetical protein